MKWLLELWATNTYFRFSLQVVLRAVLAVIIGWLIGSERARHGRAAGMRTHILVCLGATLTAMTGLFANDILGYNGDVMRLSAQVISGVGFLGSGMIILKNNDVIAGLTTAAGVWTTAAIGIALGIGFYVGAFAVTVLFLTAIILFARFERRKKSAEVLYIEIDDMHKTNQIIAQLQERIPAEFVYRVTAPRSTQSGHLGINIVIEKRVNLAVAALCDIEHIIFAVEE